MQKINYGISITAITIIASMILFQSQAFGQEKKNYSGALKAAKLSQDSSPANQTAKTLKALENIDKVKSAANPPLAEKFQPPGASATKTLQQLNKIKQIEEAQKKAARFQTLESVTIPLAKSGDYKKLTYALLVELDTSLGLSEMRLLFDENKAKIQKMAMENLKTLNDKQLLSEQKNKTVLNKVLGKVNKASKTPFVVNISYGIFELK